MSEKYKNLLIGAVKYCKDAAEKAMNNAEQNKSAKEMYDSYNEIYNKINSNEKLTVKDWNVILVAATVFSEITKIKLEGIKKLYDEDVIKKIEQVKKEPDKVDEIFRN